MINRFFQHLLAAAVALTASVCSFAAGSDAPSVAGFFPVENSGRAVYNFNQGWRFHLGDAPGAQAADFDDSAWEVVCAPHSSRLEPSGVSGCRNYQGVEWYRKHFTVPAELKGLNALLHFEGVMGKQSFYVNGRLVKEHLGGYLPITINLAECGVKAGDDAVVAVMADNSDDKSYPPGKKQNALDFAYHGGLYRDVWLLGKNALSITDAIEANTVAGGGVFFHYGNISDQKAELFAEVDVENLRNKAANPTVKLVVKDAQGRVVVNTSKKISVKAGSRTVASIATAVKKPNLWTPDEPYLYRAEVSVLEGGKSVDGGAVRIGIRKAEFFNEPGKPSFLLNGKPFRQLIGGNRHQDFAYVGNALPNSQQWRDAKRLKDAGMDIIRAAHYPQDPSFMDACDELGIFIIVPTPGWQYWNKDPRFAELVHQNTREIVRRDRNHPCVLLWEPILNETRFPADFAIEALNVTREEYPYPGRPGCAADLRSAGVKDNYDVIYDWPEAVENGTVGTPKPIFTREFGEIVDDWYAHNSINRAAREWGEVPMLTAALSLADTYGTMFHGQPQFFGGCQWHPFDHQRGYHPDAYLGGIYDAFRQTKYAYYMFRSQVPVSRSEPMLFIAHEMTPFSPDDVVVFSNCDSVRLTCAFQFADEQKTQPMVWTLPVNHNAAGQPSEPVTFKDAWNYMASRDMSYKKRNWQGVSFTAEGIVDGKVVCTEKKMPSRRSTKLRLVADEMGRQLVADGSDFIVVVAEVTDDNGNVRRMAIENVAFSVEGEGELISDDRILSNPRRAEWGSAPALVRSTNKAGKITIIAQSAFPGTHAPAADTLVIESVAPELPNCYTETPRPARVAQGAKSIQGGNALSDEEKARTLREVEAQQQEFGIAH